MCEKKGRRLLLGTKKENLPWGRGRLKEGRALAETEQSRELIGVNCMGRRGKDVNE
jgi:hypothetical protein